jgi:hypothetical protein
LRIDRRGRLLAQTTFWAPVELLDMVKLERLNLTDFCVQALMDYFGLGPVADEHRNQIVEAAQAGVARQRKVIQEREAGLERARSAVRQMRTDRDVARARQDGIADALLQIIGDDPTGRYLRTLPENDTNGDRMDDWEALVRRVCRLCGAEIDSAEVAAGVRALVAAASPADRKKG